MNKMPDIDQIICTVCYGIDLVGAGMCSIEAARLANKRVPCDLVVDYVREYIDKAITARDSGEVLLDSSGERKGRVQKVIEGVAKKMEFECPEFIFRNVSKDETKQIEEEVTAPSINSSLLIDIVNRLIRIEQKLDRAAVKEGAACEDLTDWQDLHAECKSTNKEVKMA